MHEIKFKCENCKEHISIQGTTRKVCPKCGYDNDTKKEIENNIHVPLKDPKKAKNSLLKYLGNILSF